MFGNDNDSDIPLSEARALATTRTENFKAKKKFNMMRIIFL
jgi:hypothetical protein